MPALHAARELVRRLGLVDGALFIFARALERLTRGRARFIKYYFMAQPVPRVSDRLTRPAGITVEEVCEGDPRLAHLERPAAELARRFATSSRCFAAWQGETLAGFLWFTDRQYDEDEVRCTFRVNPADRAVWDLDVHVVPRFRLGRTFGLLWEAAFTAMRSRDVRWTLSRVTAFNADSIRAHQRLGAQRTGWAVFFLFGPFQFTLTSLGQMKWGRLEHGPYPVLEVRPPVSGPGMADERDSAGTVSLVPHVVPDDTAQRFTR